MVSNQILDLSSQSLDTGSDVSKWQIANSLGIESSVVKRLQGSGSRVSKNISLSNGVSCWVADLVLGARRGVI